MMVVTGQVKYCISLTFCCWQLSNTRKVRGRIWKSHLRPGRTYRLRPSKGQIHEDELRGARSRGRKRALRLGVRGRPGQKVGRHGVGTQWVALGRMGSREEGPEDSALAENSE